MSMLYVKSFNRVIKFSDGIHQPSKRFKENRDTEVTQNQANTRSPSKIRVCLKDTTNLQVQDDSLSRTPPKIKRGVQEDPGTPSCNFKMLSSIAASLEYAENTMTDGEISPFSNSTNGASDRAVSPDDSKICRKEKSLASICERFLSSYPAYPQDGMELFIVVDDVCAELGIGRRRVYDMVNVLESIEMLKKMGKSKYLYLGKKNLAIAVHKLYIKAVALNLDEVVDKALMLEENDSTKFSNKAWEELYSQESCSNCLKKQNLLGLLSQNFIMLCLAPKEPKPISLSVAAHILSGPGSKVEKGTVQFKTKIRRLYDIANILTSVGLIEKDPSKKRPSFRYIGPSPASFKTSGTPVKDQLCCLSFSGELNVLKSRNRTFDLSSAPRRNIFPKLKSDTFLQISEKVSKPFVRHSSLQDICVVAEIERQKLFERETLESSDSYSDLNALIKSVNANANKAQEEPMCLKKEVDSKNYRSTSYEKQVKARIIIKEPPGSARNTTFLNSQPNIPCPSQKIVKNKPNMHIVTKLVKSNTVEENSPLKAMDLSSKRHSNKVLSNFIISQNARKFSSTSADLGSRSTPVSPLKFSNSKTFPFPVFDHQNGATYNLYRSASTSRASYGVNDCCSSNPNASNTSFPMSVSPITIPSNYTTPSISHLSNPVFLPTQVVSEVLSKVEQNDTNHKPFLLVRHKSAEICTKNGNSNVDSSEHETLSGDSTNEEVQQIMEQCKTDAQMKDRTYLIDEKTVYSPIKVEHREQDNIANHNASKMLSPALTFANTFSKAKVALEF